MKHIVFALVPLLLAACASVSRVPPPGAVALDVALDVGRARSLIETPASPRAASDIPEAQRIEWFEAQRPGSDPVYRPTEFAEPVETVYVDRGGTWNDWHVPISLSLGWWGGGWGHRRHGFGWGLGWNNGWCW